MVGRMHPSPSLVTAHLTFPPTPWAAEMHKDKWEGELGTEKSHSTGHSESPAFQQVHCLFLQRLMAR